MAFNYKEELGKYKKYYQALEPALRKPKNQNYTMVVFSFLTISLFGWYAIRPTIQTILYLKREIQDKTEVSKKMDTKIEALIEAQATYDQVRPYLPLIDQSLPHEPDIVQLVIQMRNLADKVGASLTGVTIPEVSLLGATATSSAKKRSAQQEQSVDVSFSLQGPFVALVKFLEGINQMRRVVQIDGIVVMPYKKTENESSASAIRKNPELQMTVNVLSYYVTQ